MITRTLDGPPLPVRNSLDAGLGLHNVHKMHKRITPFRGATSCPTATYDEEMPQQIFSRDACINRTGCASRETPRRTVSTATGSCCLSRRPVRLRRVHTSSSGLVGSRPVNRRQRAPAEVMLIRNISLLALLVAGRKTRRSLVLTRYADSTFVAAASKSVRLQRSRWLNYRYTWQPRESG